MQIKHDNPNDFYLIPKFDKLSKRDLLLMAFYNKKMLVSDGMLFWRFIDQKFPLLSYLTPEEQSQQIKNMMSFRPDNMHEALEVYADLVNAGSIHHAWLGAPAWEIAADEKDSAAERALLHKLTLTMQSKRSEISQEIHKFIDQNSSANSALAIEAARKHVAQGIINEIASMQSTSGDTHVRNFLNARYDSHSALYLNEEKSAVAWSQPTEGKHYYSGEFVDIAQELKYAPQMIPIFGFPEAKKFIAEKMHVLQSEEILKFKEEYAAMQLGLNTLRALPSIKFDNIEQMLSTRERCNSNLLEYNERMLSVARLVAEDVPFSELHKEINNTVKTELLPAIEELHKLIQSERKDRRKKHFSAIATGATALSIGMITGIDVATLLGVTSGTVSTGAGVKAAYDIGTAEIERKNLKRDINSNSKFFGLSLVLEMEKR